MSINTSQDNEQRIETFRFQDKTEIKTSLVNQKQSTGATVTLTLAEIGLDVKDEINIVHLSGNNDNARGVLRLQMSNLILDSDNFFDLAPPLTQTFALQHIVLLEPFKYKIRGGESFRLTSANLIGTDVLTINYIINIIKSQIKEEF